jgi:hypothetical protein
MKSNLCVEAAMFSYKEQKILPGLQLVFDTKNGRIVSSNFQVRRRR